MKHYLYDLSAFIFGMGIGLPLAYSYQGLLQNTSAGEIIVFRWVLPILMFGFYIFLYKKALHYRRVFGYSYLDDILAMGGAVAFDLLVFQEIIAGYYSWADRIENPLIMLFTAGLPTYVLMITGYFLLKRVNKMS